MDWTRDIGQGWGISRDRGGGRRDIGSARDVGSARDIGWGRYVGSARDIGWGRYVGSARDIGWGRYVGGGLVSDRTVIPCSVICVIRVRFSRLIRLMCGVPLRLMGRRWPGR
jgi:hypothetical protein